MQLIEHGIRNVKDVPKRIDIFKSELEKVGAKLINEYFTLENMMA